jgi:hypothetical protein
VDVQGRWNHRLKAFFGDMLAVNVAKEHIEAYRDLRVDEGASHASINREMAALWTSVTNVTLWQVSCNISAYSGTGTVPSCVVNFTRTQQVARQP